MTRFPADSGYPNMPTPVELARYAAEKRSRMVQIAQRLSQIGPRFASRTFSSFEADAGSATALVAARAAAAECRGIGFFGDAGLGKSHLAGAIVNELTARGVGAIYTGVVDMLARIKAQFEHDGGEGIIDRMADMPMLVLDDLGKEQCTEWSAATLYRIVNRRYEADLPLVATANRSIDDLILWRCSHLPDRVDPHIVAATYDRIAEMTGRWHEVTGVSRRRAS